ncbi:MAG: hypothetical protein WCF18_19275 [Chthoniobacteraceae bacterium]
MKHFIPIIVSLFAVLASVRGDDSTPILVSPGKVISQPDLKSPLGPEWSTGKGKWTPTDGVLTSTDLPEEKHIPVLHLATGPVDLVVDCEFRLNGGKTFLVGFDGNKHIGRVVITAKNVKLCEDSTEVKGKTPSNTLTESKLDLKPDEWQRLHVEATNGKLVARLNGEELRAEHPYLATPRVRWWFAAGDGAQVRNVRFREGKTIK